LANVRSETLDSFGAVSRECVLELARGAMESAGSTVGLAVSGIAGPGGGTPDKPVGTVWFAIVDNAGNSWALHRKIPGERSQVRLVAATQALDMLRRWVSRLEIPQTT
jgi:nicotinamide-nucleotide amidase